MPVDPDLLDDAIALGEQLERIDPFGLSPFSLTILPDAARGLAVILAALEPDNASMIEAARSESFDDLRECEGANNAPGQGAHTFVRYSTAQSPSVLAAAPPAHSS